MKEKILERKITLIVAAVFIFGCLCGGLVYSVFAGTRGNISVEEAKQIALEYAGVTAPKATFTKAELERKATVEVYHIDFYTTINKYEFYIDARTGVVLKKDNEAIKDMERGYIGVEKAKKIAYAHAGVTADEVQLTKCELETENDIQVYRIEFCVGDTVYGYAITANSGKLTEWGQGKAANGNGDHNAGNGNDNNNDRDKDDDNRDDDENDDEKGNETTITIIPEEKER